MQHHTIHNPISGGVGLDILIISKRPSVDALEPSRTSKLPVKLAKHGVKQVAKTGVK